MDDVILGCGLNRRFTRRQLGLHSHPAFEMIAVLAGRPRWQVDGRVQEVPAGWVHFNLPGQMHGSADAEEAPRAITWVLFGLDRDYSGRPRRFAFHPDLGIPTADTGRMVRRFAAAERHACPASAQLLWLLERIVTERRQRRVAWKALNARYAAAALYEFERCLQAPQPAATADAAEDRVRTFLRDLSTCCGEEWSLERMAATCGLGRTRFTECCHAIAGESPSAALQRRRIQQAQHLLRTTRRSITAIALDCGFGTSQYFARIFRTHTGMSASAWRRGVETGDDGGAH